MSFSCANGLLMIVQYCGRIAHIRCAMCHLISRNKVTLASRRYWWRLILRIIYSCENNLFLFKKIRSLLNYLCPRVFDEERKRVEYVYIAMEIPPEWLSAKSMCVDLAKRPTWRLHDLRNTVTANYQAELYKLLHCDVMTIGSIIESSYLIIQSSISIDYLNMYHLLFYISHYSFSRWRFQQYIL